ncbi:MAG: hypothetical protein ACFFAU_20740 [Candidatus Hodarchaeota archaeon]
MSPIVVQGAIEPTIESEIVIGIDLGHDNAINSSHLTNLTSILNTTFSSQEVVFIEDDLSDTSLTGIDVLMTVAPTVGYSDTEVEVVEEFIKLGNSVLIATGFRNQSEEPCNALMKPYGLSFNLTSSIIPENARGNQSAQYLITSRNFTTPKTPLTENVSQIVLPNAMGISFNDSKLISYQSPSILYYNPILLLNLDEKPSKNNTLISTLEFMNGARILAISSADMLNNSYIEPLVNTSSMFLDNTKFLLNAIRWLGRNTGIMNFYNPSIDKVVDQSIKIGETIHGNVTLVDSENNSISQGQVTITLERTGSILTRRAMHLDPNNSTNYIGWVSTEGLSFGWCDVVFFGNRRGYLPIELSAGSIYLESLFPSPILPNLAFWSLFLASILIFLSTALFVRTSLKKYE